MYSIVTESTGPLSLNNTVPREYLSSSTLQLAVLSTFYANQTIDKT